MSESEILAIIISSVSLIFSIFSFSISMIISKESLDDKYYEAMKPAITSMRMFLINEKSQVNNTITKEEIDRETTEGFLECQNLAAVHRNKRMLNEFDCSNEKSWGNRFSKLTEEITDLKKGKEKGFQVWLDSIDSVTNDYIKLIIKETSYREIVVAKIKSLFNYN